MTDSAEAEIKLEEVHKTFDGRKVLDGLSLEVRKSELLAVIGPSGAGKSVLLRHIVGLIQPDSGRILVGNVNMVEAAQEEIEKIRDRIGYLFQSAALLNSLSVFDNVALPLRERTGGDEKDIRDQVMSTLQRVGLADDAKKFPDELSGGMRKRAGLARAIVGKRNIFLYDEPTSGLDPIAAASITDLIRTLQEDLQATSIIVSHDLSLVLGAADRIALLDGGRIKSIGTPEEIRRSSDPKAREFLDAKPHPRPAA